MDGVCAPLTLVCMVNHMQVLDWDLLMDISGGAARAVAHAVHVKLGCCALPHQQSAATAEPRLFKPFAILADAASNAAAAHPAPGALGPSDEALHCCYLWQPREGLPDSQQAPPLLAAAWTNERSSLLAVRLLGGGSGAPLPVPPPGGMLRHCQVRGVLLVPACLRRTILCLQGGACGLALP